MQRGGGIFKMQRSGSSRTSWCAAASSQWVSTLMLLLNVDLWKPSPNAGCLWYNDHWICGSKQERCSCVVKHPTDFMMYPASYKEIAWVWMCKRSSVEAHSLVPWCWEYIAEPNHAWPSFLQKDNKSSPQQS